MNQEPTSRGLSKDFSLPALPAAHPFQGNEDTPGSLSVFIRIIEDCGEMVLRALGHVQENDGYEKFKYLTLTNARSNVLRHLRSVPLPLWFSAMTQIPSIRRDRAEEAAPIAKAWVDEECSRREESWVENPTPFEMYGEALVLTAGYADVGRTACVPSHTEFGLDFSLPALPSVRAHAVHSREMRKRPEDYENAPFMFPLGSLANKERLPTHLKLALVFSAHRDLSNLFSFSYHARVADVPKDLVDDCIWSLSLVVSIMEECSEAILRATGFVQEDEDYQLSKYIKLVNARVKLVSHLLNQDRAKEAVPFAKAVVEEDCSRGNEIWLQNPIPFLLYGETLVLTQSDDAEAAKMLRRALIGLESGSYPANQLEAVSALIQTRTWLARALRNIGLDGEAENHAVSEKWVIGWFRKNPRLMVDRELRRLLLPAGPILAALGGGEMVRKPEPTGNITKSNVGMSVRRVGILVFTTASEMAANLEKIEHLSLTDPDGAKLAADWSLWRTQEFTQFQLVHALGLHRDPKRGRTHIVFKAVEYVPTATKFQHKFRVVACGVYRIKDVLRDIEAVMGLDRGEGQEYVESVFYEMAGTYASVQFIHLTFGDGIQAWLGSGGTNVDSILSVPYDPEWRKRLNTGAPPEPMILRSGAKDVEHFVPTQSVSREMRIHPGAYENVFLALIFHNELPNLFGFSYFAQPNDAPEDIVDDCIWALSIFIRIVEDCGEMVLTALGHVQENNGYEKSKYLTLANARSNVLCYLLIRRNRAEEAVPIAKAWVDEECSRREWSWLENPVPFEAYGEALVLTRTNDDEAVKTLRRAMLGVESPSWPTYAVAVLVNTRVWLARALRNIGLDDEAEPHEEWLVRWFRKNPHYIPERELRRILLPAGSILKMLGGEE
ncbi:MYND-type domain-containing protein [Mycena sanguinolenta]|uniref:MYND-type domain-containing protein n=1 Tax=Mycena sanguinolenta TaxID=230812 RepID=A0A8H6XCU3_9AGAR|nr:MYND-type domain-containing protein [Mycena sanguinolenta]